MINRYFGELSTDVYGINADEAKLGHLQLKATQTITSDADGVHASIASKTTTQTITTDISNPPYPRNITLDIGGTAGDVKAGSIVVTGTNICDEIISETFPLEDDTSTDQVGVKAFKTVTSISIPAQEGAGATFTFGFGEKLGLPYKLAEKPLVFALDDGVLETTAPVLTIDASEIEKNTIDLSTDMDGSVIDLYIAI